MSFDSFRDCWNWWLGELRNVLPLSYRLSLAHSDAIFINVVRGNCLVERRGDKAAETLEGVPALHVGERAKLLTNASSCVIAIAEGGYLSRHLSDRKLPFTRARQMAEIDLADGTPFDNNDVHICFAETKNSAFDHDYILIKKEILDPVMESLIEVRIFPQSIVLKSDGIERKLSSESLKSIHPIFRRKTLSQRLSLASLFLLAVSGILTFGHTYYRYASADEQLKTLVSLKQNAASDVRKLLERRAQDIAAVEAARKSKAQAVPIVRVWEELTRTLPDTAWITDFSLNGDSLSFSGFATSAAGLISTLTSSPLFADPSFTSPVVRVPGQTGERFAIKLSVVRR